MDTRQEKRQKKILIWAGLLFLVLAVVAVVGYVVSLRKSAKIEILVAPSMAKISINGKNFETDGTFDIEPGLVVASITAEGFTSQEIELNFVAGETTKLYTYLIPEDGTMDWYLSRPPEMMIVTGIGSEKANTTLRDYQEKYPIAKVLPIVVVEMDEQYNWTEYRIDGGKFDDCKTAFCVKITDSTGGNQERALQRIRDAGYNPEDYQILYEYTPVKPLEQN